MKEGDLMDDIEKIVREVDSSMAMEGMPLTHEDKDRIRKCLSEPSAVEDMISSLLAKHTSFCQMEEINHMEHSEEYGGCSIEELDAYLNKIINEC